MKIIGKNFYKGNIRVESSKTLYFNFFHQNENNLNIYIWKEIILNSGHALEAGINKLSYNICLIAVFIIKRIKSDFFSYDMKYKFISKCKFRNTKWFCFTILKNEETLNIVISFENVLSVDINLHMYKLKHVIFSTNHWHLCHAAMRNMMSLVTDHHGPTQDRPTRHHAPSVFDSTFINSLLYIFHPQLIPI